MSHPTHPEVLASTQWVADHLNDSQVRFVEVGIDASDYEAGHIPGAVAGWSFADLQRLANKAYVEGLLSDAGIANSHTVVLYGGTSNLIAVMAFWMLRVYGHADLRLLDGGRQKWLAEGRPLSTERPSGPPTQYLAQKPNWNLRADKSQVVNILGQSGQMIVDARPAAMYAGENKAGLQRGGHLPGAINVPAMPMTDAVGNFQGWQPPTLRGDGTFKSAEELQVLFSEKGITPDKHIVLYCLRGELSTHLWFTLTQLLGYPHVHEYDRSWAEWSKFTNLPIEK